MNINVNSYMKSIYAKLDLWLFRKNKPKQTQSCPPQADSKPKQIQSVFCILYPVLYILFIKSFGLLSASQRFAVDKLMRKRRSMRIKKLTVRRLIANLRQRRVIWRFCCFLIWGIGTCFLGDRKMQSYKKLFVIIILTSLVSIGFAQTNTSSSGAAGNLFVSYMAEITGDNVYVRSGPGTNFYDCSKLNKGDKVKVMETQFSWAHIVPPPGSFSWISIQYVKIDSANPTVGTVTGAFKVCIAIVSSQPSIG